MSVKVISMVWEHSEQKEGTLVILLALADCAQDDGRNAFPSVETLARKARMSERNARYCLRRLEESGEIERIGKHGPGTTIYRICIEKWGANLAGANLAGGQFDAPQGGNPFPKGGQPVAPEPSITVIEPSIPPLSPKGESAPKNSGETNDAPKPKRPAGKRLDKENPYWHEHRRWYLFHEYWDQHPRKVAKDDAMRAWRLVLGEDDRDEDVMRAFATRFSRELEAWKRRDPEKIPHFATWINRRDWENDLRYPRAVRAS